MKKLDKKTKIIIGIVVTILILFMGFYPMITRKEKVTNTTNNKELKIYVMNNDAFLKKVINEFKASYPDVIIKTVEFNDLEQLRKKQFNEIMAGEGPDVVYFDNYLIDSINKIMKTGAFTDLKPLIEKSKGFKMEDYNEKVMECGLYKNQLLFFPISYSIPCLFTTSQLLEKNNINLESNLTRNEFIEKVKPYIDSIDGKSDKYIFSDYLFLSEFLESSGVDFIDYENKTVDLNKPEIAELIKGFKNLYEHTSYGSTVEKYLNQQYDMLKDGSTLFINDKSFIQPENIMFSNSFIKHLTNQTEVVYPVPTFKGDNKIIAIAEECMAINNNTGNKEMAFNFIKTALSESLQSDESSIKYIPVNKGAFNNIMNDTKEKFEGKDTIYNDQKFIMQAIPEELESDYKSIINNVVKCKFIDSRTESLMLMALQGYFENKASYEDAIKEAESKIKLYLNE